MGISICFDRHRKPDLLRAGAENLLQAAPEHRREERREVCFLR